jgi:hypothetical protein
MRCPECDRDLGEIEDSDQLVRCVFCGAQLPDEAQEDWDQDTSLELADIAELSEPEEPPEEETTPPPEGQEGAALHPHERSFELAEVGGEDSEEPEKPTPHAPQRHGRGGAESSRALVGHPDQETETVSRKQAERPGLFSGVLGVWCVMMGMLTVSLALGSVLSRGLSIGMLPVLGGSLSVLFAGAALAALGTALAYGRPASYGTSWLLGIVCLAGCGFLFADNISRGVQWYMEAKTSLVGPHLETLLTAVVLIALGMGCTVLFVRRAAWTFRVVAVAVLSWIALVVLLHDALALPTGMVEVVVELEMVDLLFVGGLALCAAGLGAHMIARAHGKDVSAVGLVLMTLWVVLLLGAAVWLGQGRRWPTGLVGQAGRLTHLAVFSVVIGFAVPLLMGVLIVWRGDQPLSEDAAGAIDTGWWAGVAGAALIIGRWFAGGRVGQGPALWLVAGGAVAPVMFAWLGARGKTMECGLRHDNWAARWAFLPAIIVVAIALGGLTDTIELVGGWRTNAVDARLAGLFLWTLLVAWALLATWGLVLEAYLSASHQPDSVRAETNLLSRPGMLAAVVGIVLVLIGVGTGPVSGGGLQVFLGGLWAALLDLTEFCGMVVPTRTAGSLLRNIWGAALPGSAGPAAGLVLLVGLFAVHFLASRGTLWARQLMGLLWLPAILVGGFILAGLGTALFHGHADGPWRTGMGNALARNMTVRFVLFGILAATVIRLAGGVRVALTVSDGQQGVDEETVRGEPFRALNVFGMLVLAALLVLCALLMWDSSTEAVFYQLHDLFARGLAEAVAAVRRTSETLTSWPGYVVGTGLMFVVAVLVHEETRRGHLHAYPFVGVAWTGIVVWGAGICWGLFQRMSWPGEPGMRAVLLLLGILWFVLCVNVLVLWARWWVYRREHSDLETRLARKRRGMVPARGLCRMGALGTVVLGTAVFTASFWSRPAAGGWSERGLIGLGELWNQVAFQIEFLRVHLETAGVSGTVLPAACGVLLLLLAAHFLAQMGWRRIRAFILALWTVALLLGVFAFGHLIDFGRMGHFSPERSLLLAVGGVLILFLAATATGGWVWLFESRR